MVFTIKTHVLCLSINCKGNELIDIVPDFICMILITLIVIVNAFIFSTLKYNNIKTFMTDYFY